jgi:uncharacterized protein
MTMFFITTGIMTLPLTAIEARVLATLMEKARTVPDSYPLSLNSLVLGCNQKTSRDPLMELSESDVSQALDRLLPAGLVRETSGSRVPRYEHNFQRGIGVPEQSAVLLGLLMLRGPQTAAELRLNTERWYKFADISSVEAFLEELQERNEDKGGPLVVKLDKAPGAREQRWAHLLCGPVDTQALAAARSLPGTSAQGAIDASQRIAKLEADVAALQATVQMLCKELGMSQPGQEE